MASSIHRAVWSFLLISLLQIGASESLRILGIFPLNGKSHFVMGESLLRGLAEHGHQVDVYSHFPLKKPIPNYRDFSLAGSIPSLRNNVSYEFSMSFGDVISVPQLMNLAGQPICELMNLPIFQKLLKHPPKNPPYDVVITEMFFSNCYLAWGRHLNVPVVGLVTLTLPDWLYDSLGNPTNLATDPSVFLGSMAPMNFFARLRNVVLSNYIKMSFNYFAHEQDALVKGLFGSETPDVIELQKDLSLVLVNYHQALNGIRSFTPAVVPVGTLHVIDTNDSLSRDTQKFLDESKDGFVYVSFGSMVRLETFPKPTLDAFYNTFKRISPVRVLVKIAKPEDLPPGLPSNVITQTWLPQIKVLKHPNIRCFITHGGLMGTQEAIYFGVPLVGIPLFGDQAFNVDSYVKKNLAVKVDKHEITEESLFEAVNEVLGNPMYRKSSDSLGKKIRDVPLSPMETAVFWIEYVVRHGRHALRAPVVDMPWYEANLLDVYGFIVVVLLLAFYIIKVMVTMMLEIGSTGGGEAKKKIKKN